MKGAVPVLLEALRAHRTTIAVVPSCPVHGLEYRNGAVTALETGSGRLRVGGAKIVLAMGATENTRLVLASFPREVVPLAGSNLTANSAIFFMCRIPRRQFANLSAERPELSALYIEGRTDDREFVLHLGASAMTDPMRDRETIYRLLPDVFGDGVVDRLADKDHVVFLVNGVSEIAGQRSADSPSRTHLDGNGNTVVDFRLEKSDHQALEALDQMTHEVISTVANDAAVEYWSSENRQWVISPPCDPRMPFAFSEGGTLWMGRSADTSVTDVHCRLHHVENVHVAGGAVFPTHGAWNPLLTMTALSMRLGRHLTS